MNSCLEPLFFGRIGFTATENWNRRARAGQAEPLHSYTSASGGRHPTPPTFGHRADRVKHALLRSVRTWTYILKGNLINNCQIEKMFRQQITELPGQIWPKFTVGKWAYISLVGIVTTMVSFEYFCVPLLLGLPNSRCQAFARIFPFPRLPFFFLSSNRISPSVKIPLGLSLLWVEWLWKCVCWCGFHASGIVFS